MILQETYALSNAVLAGIGQDYGDGNWSPVFSKKNQL